MCLHDIALVIILALQRQRILPHVIGRKAPCLVRYVCSTNDLAVALALLYLSRVGAQR